MDRSWETACEEPTAAIRQQISYKPKYQVVHCSLGIILFCDLRALLAVLAWLCCTTENEGMDLGLPWIHVKVSLKRAWLAAGIIRGQRDHYVSEWEWTLPPTQWGASPSIVVQGGWGLSFIKDASGFLYLPKSEQSPQENENGGFFHPNPEAALGQAVGVPGEERKIN